VPSSFAPASADIVVFILEWWLDLDYAGRLNPARLLSVVPRERRVVIDNEGMYNDPIEVWTAATTTRMPPKPGRAEFRTTACQIDSFN
jgi:hypothetical protein